MYLYKFPQQQQEKGELFEEGHMPVIAKLSHSFHNPHWSFQYHIHKDQAELVYFSEGEADYSVNLEVFHVKKGDTLIIDPGNIHSIRSNPDAPISCWTCGIRGFRFSDREQPMCFLTMNRSPHYCAGIHEPVIHAIFQEMEHLHMQETEDSHRLCSGLAISLAHLYHYIYQNAPVNEALKPVSFVHDILLYINEHYTESIQLKDLERIFHMSADHISHEFKKVYGISPINYAIDRRICEAKWMLINTKDSLVSITRKVGYDNTTHFSDLFLKRVGYMPLKYRELFGVV